MMTKYPEPFPKNHVIVLFDFAGTKKKNKRKCHISKQPKFLSMVNQPVIP